MQNAVLRPSQDLFAHGIVAVLALTTPVFAVLYWLTVPDGPWLLVAGTHAVVVTAALLGVRSFFNTTITLGADGVVERGFFGRKTVVTAADVGSVILVQLYDGNTLDTLPQLFVTGRDGRLLIRLRGEFWPADEMERIAEELDAPILRYEESMTLTQLRRTSPELLDWFERVPRFGG